VALYRSPIPRTTASKPTQLAAIVREIAAAGVAATAAGIIAGGVGGRLAMRVSALVNPTMAGVRSENGNRIGDVTVDGTIALVLFGGLLTGAVVAWSWVAVRTWLPQRPSIRYAAGATAALGLTGFLVVHAGSIDFFLLEPGWLHILMFCGLVAGAGALTVSLDQRLVARWPASGGFTVLAAAVVAQGVFFSFAGVGAFFTGDLCNCENPPTATGLLLLATAVITAATWVSRLKGRATPLPLQVIGTAAAIGAITTGLIQLGGQIAAIV
jgi:hypothetical protein